MVADLRTVLPFVNAHTYCASRVCGPFLETPDNLPGPKTILGAQYSPIAIAFLLILKAKF